MLIYCSAFRIQEDIEEVFDEGGAEADDEGDEKPDNEGDEKAFDEGGEEADEDDDEGNISDILEGPRQVRKFTRLYGQNKCGSF